MNEPNKDRSEKNKSERHSVADVTMSAESKHDHQAAEDHE
jgi:hypothetical protein